MKVKVLKGFFIFFLVCTLVTGAIAIIGLIVGREDLIFFNLFHIGELILGTFGDGRLGMTLWYPFWLPARILGKFLGNAALIYLAIPLWSYTLPLSLLFLWRWRKNRSTDTAKTFLAGQES